MTQRTLVVTSTFPQFAGDPRGQFILRHWEASVRSGMVVRVVAPRTAWTDGTLESACEIVRVAYAPKAWSSLSGRHGILENIRERPWRGALLPAFLSRMKAAVEREILRFRPQLVVAHMWVPMGWLVAGICTRLNVPFEMWGHGTDIDVVLALPDTIRHRFESLLAHARAISVPSQEKLERVRARVNANLVTRVQAMEHVVPPAPAAILRRRVATAPERVLFLGRLIRQKGVDDLIRAIASSHTRLRLDVAGDGPERRGLAALARRLNVEAVFHGFVIGSEKERLFASADVLCVPSRVCRGGLSEGAPLVIREAFARGLPVVATHIGGIPELCAHGGRAILVDPGDLDGLLAALLSVNRGTFPETSAAARTHSWNDRAAGT